MRVLVVTQYFRPQPLANAETIGCIVSGLARRGHRVHVVSPVRGAPSEPNVVHHRAFGYFARDRASLPKRVLEYASFSVGALVAGLRVPRPDVVFVPSPPPTLGLVGLALAAGRRSRLVYNVQDFYPEVAVATGAVRAGALLVTLGRLMRWVYRRSAAVVVIDPSMEDAVREAEPDATVRAVRNGIDLVPFLEARRSATFLDEIGAAANGPVVMYAGNVGRSQDLAPVAKAALDCGATFVVHGGGAALEDLRAEADAAGWSHVRFSGYRPHGELGTVFASADLHVVPLKPGVAAVSVPSKVLSIWAAGRPAVVVAEAGSVAAALVDETGAGWVVEPGDPGALARAIAEALGDPLDMERRGRRGREWAFREAGPERCGRDYEAVLREAVGASLAPAS